MKRIVFIMAGLLGTLTACQDAPKADNAETTEAVEVATTTAGSQYTVNAGETKIEWIGTKPVGKHHGTIKVKDGSVTVKDGQVQTGRIVMDVNSIQPDDQDEKGNTKLRGHLLSADFFEAEKYPEAVFEITSVSAGTQVPENELVMKDATHTVTGNLTIKSVTKSISFPAKIQVDANRVVTDASFNIDRTQWNLNYGNDKGLGDKFIYPEVNFTLHLVANK